jgi:hypothetical protein
VRNARIVCATVVLAASIVGALWVYTHRVWTVYGYVQYSDQAGYYFHAVGRGRETVWWSAPASVALLFLGAATVLWLLPGKSLMGRFTDHFASATRAPWFAGTPEVRRLWGRLRLTKSS